MSKYYIAEVNITRKTAAYKVVDSAKWTVAVFGKLAAAENFRDYMNDNNIESLEDWEKVPRKVKLAFISSTLMITPVLRSSYRVG